MFLFKGSFRSPLLFIIMEKQQLFNNIIEIFSKYNIDEPVLLGIFQKFIEKIDENTKEFYLSAGWEDNKPWVALDVAPFRCKIMLDYPSIRFYFYNLYLRKWSLIDHTQNISDEILDGKISEVFERYALYLFVVVKLEELKKGFVEDWDFERWFKEIGI